MKNKMFVSWCKRWLWDFCFIGSLKFIIICAFLFITYNFSKDRNDPAAIIFAGFTVLFFLYFYGSQFEIIEIFGAKFKAKEIKKSIDELKIVTKILTRICFGIAQASGRFDGIPEEDLKLMYLNANKLFKLLNFDEKEQQEVFSEWQKWTKIDNAGSIRKYLQRIKDGNDILLNLSVKAELNDVEKEEINKVKNKLSEKQIKNSRLYSKAFEKIREFEAQEDIIEKLDEEETKILLTKIALFDKDFNELYKNYLGEY